MFRIAMSMTLMPSKNQVTGKLNFSLSNNRRFSRAVHLASLFFGKVEGILIIPLEKWKFVHKLR